jgi:hypothetical protein
MLVSNGTQPRYLANAASSAVTPISPAAKKFNLFILCSTFNNSPWSISFAPRFLMGKRHIAAMNQNIAEPHAAIMIPVSTYDLIITPHGQADLRGHPILNYPFSTQEGLLGTSAWYLADITSELIHVRFWG